MAMQNMYNYKRPSNYHQQIQELKREPVQVVPTTPKSNHDRYLEQKILHAKPEELTMMLYEGIIKFLNQSKLYLEQKNIEKCSSSLVRAQDIIEELNGTLDMSFDVSNNLRMLYVFMNTRLMEANIKKDTVIIDEVLELAADLRDTWKEAMQSLK